MSRKVTLVLAFLIVLILLFVTANALFIPGRGDSAKDEQFPLLNGLSNWVKNLLGGFGGSESLLKEPPVFPGFIQKSNYLLVTYAPSNVQWHEIDKGESQCTLPTGKIDAGDIIKDCSGIVTLVYTPARQTLGTWEFGDQVNDDDTINDNNDNNIQNPDDDTQTLPTIEIIKPVDESFYFLNKRKKETVGIRILGDIDIEARIDNPSNMQIDGVRFYINNEYRSNDTQDPYRWNWDEKYLNQICDIKCVVYNVEQGDLAQDEKTVLITNLCLI